MVLSGVIGIIFVGKWGKQLQKENPVEASEDDDVDYTPQHNYQTKILSKIKAEQNEVSIVEIAPKLLIIKND